MKVNVFRNEVAQRRSALRISNRHYPKDRMVPMPPEQVQKDGHKLRLAAFRSKDFLAQVFGLPNSDMLRLTVQRMELNRAGDFIDLITWEDLAWVKRQCGFGECDAVEAFPADADVVGTGGARYIFIFPANYVVPFFYRKQTNEPNNTEPNIVRLEPAGGEPDQKNGAPASHHEADAQGTGGQPGEAPCALPKLSNAMDSLRDLRKL